MGTNRRYADAVDRRMDANIAMRSGTPQSLTDAELELSVQSIIRAPQPVACRAWVRYPEGPAKVDARAVAWTLRAVAIEWDAPDRRVHRAWVWASAVSSA